MPNNLVRVHHIDCALVMRLARVGLTNAEIAEVVEVTREVFESHVVRDEALLDALIEGRANPNRMVVASLFKRAVGYQYEQVTEEDGRPIKKVIKHVVPDVAAMNLWLRHKDPENWDRPKQSNVNLTFRDRAALASGR